MADSITLDEKFALSELRRHMKAELPPDVYTDTILLLKFLKARDFNVEQAEIMLRKNLRWKKEMQIDTILKDYKPSEVLEKYLDVSHIGYSKDGYPVNYISAGQIDARGVFKSTNYIPFLKHLLRIYETDRRRQARQTQKLGKSITQSINIYNVGNLPMSQVTHRQTVQNAIRGIVDFQDNYPEFLKTLYVINASVYFTFIWPVVKKCVGSGLMEKIRIYGQDGWKEEFLQLMDADQLPAFLGGNKTDPDGNPLCLSFVNHGGLIPEGYYVEKDIKRFERKYDVRSVKIERQSNALISVQITNNNSIIHWEFEIKSQDIGFGIFYETDNGASEELVPVHRMKTELEPYNGMYRCKDVGKYVIVFDNTHSWFHPKEVYYRIWMTNASEET